MTTKELGKKGNMGKRGFFLLKEEFLPSLCRKLQITDGRKPPSDRWESRGHYCKRDPPSLSFQDLLVGVHPLSLTSHMLRSFPRRPDQVGARLPTRPCRRGFGRSAQCPQQSSSVDQAVERRDNLEVWSEGMGYRNIF